MALNATVEVQSPITNPVTRSKLDNLVATAKVTIGGQATAEQIASGAVTVGKLAVDAVETANIANGAVTAEKIADGALTLAGLAPQGALLVGATSNRVFQETFYTNTKGSWVDVFSVSIAKKGGGPVLLLGAINTSGLNSGIRIVRGGVPVLLGNAAGSRTQTLMQSNGDDTAMPIVLMDIPGSGTVTYTLQARTEGTFAINRDTTDTDIPSKFRGVSTLVAIELLSL